MSAPPSGGAPHPARTRLGPTNVQRQRLIPPGTTWCSLPWRHWRHPVARRRHVGGLEVGGANDGRESFDGCVLIHDGLYLFQQVRSQCSRGVQIFGSVASSRSRCMLLCENRASRLCCDDFAQQARPPAARRSPKHPDTRRIARARRRREQRLARETGARCLLILPNIRPRAPRSLPAQPWRRRPTPPSPASS